MLVFIDIAISFILWGKLTTCPALFLFYATPARAAFAASISHHVIGNEKPRLPFSVPLYGAGATGTATGTAAAVLRAARASTALTTRSVW
jgi:hypothetical protein